MPPRLRAVPWEAHRQQISDLRVLGYSMEMCVSKRSFLHALEFFAHTCSETIGMLARNAHNQGDITIEFQPLTCYNNSM